ncbi:MAG TPA: DNA polymerase Y family protein [Tepidisphaeraceae bacterium]|nr:DNA polymerase Y family protein [Tepidisphaeraceae bacterium]
MKNVATRQVIMAASREAQARGICCEMTLAEACALCPNLEHGEYQPREDRKGLMGLARWMMRFSPVVALDPSDDPEADPLPAVFMDVGGCERLYGGLGSLMEQLEKALRRLRLHITLAIAPTAGSAWAIAVSGRHGTIVGAEDLPGALSQLTPDVLRIDPATSEMLHHLGIRTIGQLMKLPRESLPARFGAQLLMRLDQALGRIDEPLVPVNYQTPVEARIDFEGPIDALETIWSAFGEMVKEIIRQLAARGCGARRMEIEFLRPYAPVISKTILLARASRDGKNLFNLIRCAMETLEEEAGNRGKKWKKRSRLAHLAASEDFSSDGFIGLRVRVPVFERLSHEQVALLKHEERAAEVEFDQLIERLCLRLGDESVIRPYLVESHIPEKAYACVQAASPSGQLQIANCKSPIPRPLRLLNSPIAIRAMVSPSHDRDGRPISFTLGRHVHRLVHAIGPERIAGQWWEGHHKTRDYFIVEDENGRRFWIFRVMQSSRWYIHGEFE